MKLTRTGTPTTGEQDLSFLQENETQDLQCLTLQLQEKIEYLEK